MKKLVFQFLAGALFLFPAVACAQTIKIGVAGPMDGSNRRLGQQLKNGVTEAVEAINASTNARGQKYSVNVYHDACDSEQATKIVHQAKNDGVKIIIGHFCNGSSMAASRLYDDLDMLMISPASSETRLTERQLWNTFRVAGRDDQQGAVAAQYILKNFAGKKIAILHDRTAYGSSLADETRKALNAGGLKERFSETFRQLDRDFTGIVSRLRAESIDLVHVSGLYDEIGPLLRQMRSHGLQTILMSGNGIVAREFAGAAGPAVDGALFTFGPEAALTSSAAHDFFKTLSRRNVNPEGHTIFAYAATQAIAQAVAAAKSAEPRQVAAALKNGTFSTALGQLSFDAKGDRRQASYVVYQWNENGYRQYYVPPVGAATPVAASPPSPPVVQAPPPAPPPPVVQAPPPPAPPPVVANVPPPKQVAPVAAPKAAAPPDRRVALVIGNSAYKNVSPLTNPQRDASTIATALRQSGFQSVTLVTDLDRNKLTAALQKFAEVAETADWSVVYFAGHGMEIGGVNYLIPIDAKLGSDRDIEFQAVSLNTVLNAAERAKKLRLVILDACRDNPFAAQMKRTMANATRSVGRGLAFVEPEAGTMVVYAAKHGETALDGSGSNSPFATALAKNLLTPGLEVRLLFDTVRDDVMDSTDRKQQPFSYGSISARQQFYFTAAR
ncbi:MAG: hypothetical protein A4S14_10420 [Proteobacteria bacterium SG_bin9]|nr:MAG: hypothetical protein A4S14_10420 [Proteobacteria bacterium SG_bin9]